MNKLRPTILTLSAIILFTGAFAVTSNAQRFVVRTRPVIVRTHPYGWGIRHDPYWNNPYYFERQELNYDRRAVNDAKRRLDNDRIKYQADGFITVKEQDQLTKDRIKYDEAVERLRRDR